MVKFEAFALLCSLLVTLTDAYDGDICCNKAKEEGAFINPSVPLDKQICGQTYSDSLEPATPLSVSFHYCWTNCSGMGLSKADEPSEWAAPIVQFILPSVIFSMTIPRRKKIEYDYLFDWDINFFKRKPLRWMNGFLELGISLVLFAVILIPVFFDTVLWIFAIVVTAGNMIVGGLYEAHLDYRIVKYVKGLKQGQMTEEEFRSIKQELLVSIPTGNLSRKDNAKPHEAILKAISIPGDHQPKDGNEKALSRLLNLLGAQSSFGSAVGSPVLFYLGAFVYTILDLRNNPSSQDAAISLGFGIEWMIIVHVAIISGCLLASNNPSTSEGIVGAEHEELKDDHHLPRAPTLPRQGNGTGEAMPLMQLNSSAPSNPAAQPDLSADNKRHSWGWFQHKILGWSNTYGTEFQPVTLWSRGTNKMECVKNTAAWGTIPSVTAEQSKFRELMKITWVGWLFKVFAPAFVLIVLPPATGGVVAYFTPPRGIACRSLSFIIYASCQVAVTVIATLRNGGYCFRRRGVFVACSAIFWFGSLVAAVGGTTMQIVGVYRNCICYTTASTWVNVWKKNPSVQLASDTQNARDSSDYWIWMGATASIFMALNCYVGWWYQRFIRRRFTEAVKAMYGDTRRLNGNQNGYVNGGAMGPS